MSPWSRVGIFLTVFRHPSTEDWRYWREEVFPPVPAEGKYPLSCYVTRLSMCVLGWVTGVHKKQPNRFGGEVSFQFSLKYFRTISTSDLALLPGHHGGVRKISPPSVWPGNEVSDLDLTKANMHVGAIVYVENLPAFQCCCVQACGWNIETGRECSAAGTGT